MKHNLKRLLADYPLETLLQTIPTGLFLVDADRTIVYWNGEAERITGYRADEVVGKHCSLLDGNPCGKKCALFDEATEKPNVGRICEVRHKNGQVLTLSKNVDLLRDQQGQVIGGIESFVDISRLKQLENNLRAEVAEKTAQSEREKAGLRAVLDGMVDPAYISDDQYHIIFANRAMCEIIGHDGAALCYEAIHRRDKICPDCPMPQIMRGEIVRQEKTLDDSGRLFELIHTPYPDAEHPTHKLAVCRDLTDRIESERRLAQTNRELDAFVSTVSHDLRSPLTPLIGFTELLEERYAEQLDEVGRVCITEIRNTAERMKALLEDLLSLSRVGQLKVPERPVDATAIAKDVLMELGDKVLERQALVSIGPLPAVRIPETLLNDLFRNLLENALKYAAPKDPHIEISGRTFSDRVRYEVIDHGPGIDVEEREEIFEPFRRGSGSLNSDGTGIGLATVAKIARVFGGSAWVSQTPGGGATFNVDLVIAHEDR